MVCLLKGRHVPNTAPRHVGSCRPPACAYGWSDDGTAKPEHQMTSRKQPIKSACSLSACCAGLKQIPARDLQGLGAWPGDDQSIKHQAPAAVHSRAPMLGQWDA